LKNPSEQDTSAMLDRWRIYLQSYDFTIEHRPEKLEDEIIAINHDLPTSGHLGIEKTFWKISSAC